MSFRIAVAGTGTEIGKTHITSALAHELKGRGGLALKPVESGGVADAEALSVACGVHNLPAVALGEPISPHLAARREGRQIDMAELAAWVSAREAAAACSTTLVETAGGLFSPLAPGCTNATLVGVLEPDVLLLVAPDRLGVLHDVTATLLAWGQRDAPRVVVAMSAPEHGDAATSSNAAELATLGIAEVAAIFPRASHDDEGTVAAARKLLAVLLG